MTCHYVEAFDLQALCSSTSKKKKKKRKGIWYYYVSFPDLIEEKSVLTNQKT